MKSKKGFTLIEIMIVLSIIAILTPVVIPKVKVVKKEAINKKVNANIFMVKAFLEDRRFLDKSIIYDQYEKKTQAEQTEVLLSNVLNTVKLNVGQAMEGVFTASRAIENPFTDSTAISYNVSDITLFNSDCSVVVVKDTRIPPENEESIIYPDISDWKKYSGKIIVTIFKDRYSGYGVDRDGNIVSPFIVKMPSNDELSVIPVTPGGGDPGGGTPGDELTKLKENFDSIVDYLKSRINYDLGNGSGKDDKEKFFMQNLWNNGYGTIKSIKAQFGRNGSKHLINPYTNGTGIYYEKNKSSGKWINDLDKNVGRVPSSGSIIVLEKSQFIENNDGTVNAELAKLYKGYIVVSPINTIAQGNDVSGYWVRAIDNSGNVVYKVEIRRQ